jgi:hypothetical protein
MLHLALVLYLNGGTEDDWDNFRKRGSIYIDCRVDFIIDVLHGGIVGIETLKRSHIVSVSYFF